MSDNSTVSPNPASLLAALWRERDYHACLLLTLGVAHAVLYVLDPGVQFFLGDSASYLLAADHSVPLDRSYVYGRLIRWCTAGGADLSSLVAAQVLVWIATSWLFAVLLRVHFQVAKGSTFALTLAASLLPVHVVWTRFVMTETPALAVFTAMLVIIFEYLRSDRWWRLGWLVPLQVLGIAAVALRTAMLPVALFSAIVVPVVGVLVPRRAPWPKAGATLALHVGVALACMLPLHAIYKHDYAQQIQHAFGTGQRPAPAYSYASGQFYVEFWAPLIEAGDFPDGVDGQAILAATARQHGARERNLQHWAPDGMVQRVRESIVGVPSPTEREFEVDRICKEAAISAALRDPLGVLGLAWHTFSDYWDPGYLQGHLRAELGLDRLLPDETRELLQGSFGFDVGDRTLWLTPIKRGFLAMWPYVAALSLAGAAVLFVWRGPRSHRPYHVVLLLLLLYFWAALHLLSTLPSGRFEHPVSWLLWLLVAGRVFGRAPQPPAS